MWNSLTEIILEKNDMKIAKRQKANINLVPYERLRSREYYTFALPADGYSGEAICLQIPSHLLEAKSPGLTPMYLTCI